jgi:MFS transporter, PAT family, beta-lactamase induction signal transducer AmpG
LECYFLAYLPGWQTASEIAAFAVVVALPPSFKFVVAPLMDRYTYLPMGRKRPWVILGQIGLVVSCIFMAYVPDPLNNLNQLMLAGFVVTFFSSFQDVATDGMAVDIIPQNQQARANGLMWGSMIIAISTSLALGTWLLNKYDFSMPAFVIGIIMLVPIFLRERQGEKILPWTSGTASPETKQLQLNSFVDIFKSLYSVFSLRNSLLLALLIFIGLGSFKYIGTLLPIFTVKELSWTNVEYSQYYASAKLIGGIVGMLLGGVLIEKFGKKTMINIYFFGLVFFITVLSFSKNYWSDKTFIYAFMIAHNILYTFTSIGVFAVAMQCCWKKISASQFALYMTIANLGQISLAALIGPIKENFSWQITLFAYAIMVGVAWLLLQFLNINKQIECVAVLENKDVGN